MRLFLPALLIVTSIAARVVHADTTVPPTTNVTPELAAAAARLVFEPARPTLRKESISAVDAIANWLRAHSGARIEIAVHTDAQGAAEWNLRLSQSRAEGVRDALVERKIAPERLVARGYGETQPIAPNTTVEGRRRNQRVEVRMVAAR